MAAEANASAIYACRNKGGNFPVNSKKTTVSGPVSASGQFTSGKNGQITSSLLLKSSFNHVGMPRRAAGGSGLVSYTNVSVSGGGDTQSIPGTFSRTYFNI